MKKAAGVTLIILLAVPTHGFAAPPSQTTKKRTGSPKKTTTAKAGSPVVAPVLYDTKDFDQTAKALPPSYRGHSFQEVYDVAVVVSPKGEFETTAEYEQRTKRTLDGLYAFVVEPKSKYNADEEILEVALETSDYKVGTERERESGYIVESKQVAEREYLASNAFGAKTLVTSTTYEVSAILPKLGPLSGGATFSLKVPRADAQRLKPNVRVLAIGSIDSKQEPVIAPGSRYNGSKYIEAKIDSPSETVEKDFLLRMNLTDLWVFDTKSGTILAKHSDNPDHDKMRISVYESKDHDGYAVVSVVGNEDLTLKRNFAKYGGGCHVTVGGVNEITGMKKNVWGVGSGLVDLLNRKRLVVTSSDGTVLLDEGVPTTYGRDAMNTAWPYAEAAARMMWQASPDGFVELKKGDLRFASKASLAGFRELWTWGIANCGFTSLEK